MGYASLEVAGCHKAWQLLSAGVASGLVFFALTNTCGMDVLLAKLPNNRPRPADREHTLAILRR